MKIEGRLLLGFMLCVICIPRTGISVTGISVSPSSITFDTNTWVDIEITGITPGAKVVLGLHVDVGRDGNLDPGDSFLTAFNITDGELNSLNSRVIVDDDDGVANGSIQTSISFHGDSIVRIIGKYLWSVTEVEGNGERANHAFEVTQPPSSAWVTGSIADSVSSNSVPGAIAIIEYPAVYGMETRTFADTNGVFRIYVPTTVPLDRVHAVTAVGLGHLSSELSYYEFTIGLAPGENYLPVSLKIIPPTALGLASISGHIYDENTNAVSGAFMSYDNDAFSIFITDTNGFFELPVHMESEAELGCEWVNMSGLMDFEQELYIGGNTNIDIYLPTANVLAKARVADDYTGEPLVGVAVEFNALAGEHYDGTGYSLDDGYYEIGLLGNRTYGEAEIDVEDELYPQGYATATRYSDVYVPPSGGVYMLAPFWATKGYILSGHVYDQYTNSLSDGFLLAHEYPETGLSSYSYTDPTRGGFYALLVPAGTNEVETHEFDGYVNDSLIVEVTTNGLTGVDFYLAVDAPVYYPGNGHWYMIMHESQGWHEAQNICTNMGGHLATITSEGEDQFIFYTLVNPTGNWGWLGGTDEGDEGNWRWITGELWAYENWNQHEPNNMGGTEHYLQYFDGDTFGWNDVPNAGGSFICEWENSWDIDVDLDGIPDIWETSYFGARNNCNPSGDEDLDGSDNLTEYISGMDPTNALSCFMITNSLPLPGEFLIEWPSASGRIYTALWSTNLTAGFQAFESDIYYPSNSSTDTIHSTEGACFYRVEVRLE